MNAPTYKGGSPAQLTPADVWMLCRDGFNANEIAEIGATSPTIAGDMIDEARAIAHESYRAGYPQEIREVINNESR